MSNAFPTWSGAGGIADDAWNTVILGNVTIPGMCSVKGLDAGLKADKRRKRGADGATSRDLGIEPSKFTIETVLTEDDWPAWLVALPKINPRTVGRVRQPVEIVHPAPNMVGVTQVRIVKLQMDPPTARGGMLIKIQLEEWFGESKDIKQGPTQPSTQYYPKVGFQQFNNKTGDLYTSQAGGPFVADTDNMMLRTFPDLPAEPPHTADSALELDPAIKLRP